MGMPASLKRDAPEWIALVGGALAVVSQGIRLRGQIATDLLSTLSYLGAVIFVAGLIALMRDVAKRLGTIDTNALNARLDVLTAAQQVLTNAALVAEVLEWAQRNPDEVHFAATRDTVHHLVSAYAPRITLSLRQYAQTDAANRPALRIEDHSPIHDLMWRLGKGLPTGSAWFGITRLQHRSAWETPDESFKKFIAEMRERAPDDLHVVRLYHFSDETAYAEMRSLLEEEQRQGIVVRYLIRAQAPSDVSLVWSPPAKGRSGAESGGAKDVVGQARRAGRRPICALEYVAHAGAHLLSVEMHPGESQRFAELAREFAAAWKEGRELPTAPSGIGTSPGR